VSDVAICSGGRVGRKIAKVHHNANPARTFPDSHQLVESKTDPAASQRRQTKVFMIQDFKFALRQLLKAPGFTATAVLTLALAIGVNSAIFALINSVVLHPVVPLRPNEV
jgi:hypothetical protein